MLYRPRYVVVPSMSSGGYYVSKKISSVIKGKTYLYYQVVESYRENGKVKHRNLYSVGVLTEDEAAKLRLVIAAQSDKNIIITKIDDIVVTKHLAHLYLIEGWCQQKILSISTIMN